MVRRITQENLTDKKSLKDKFNAELEKIKDPSVKKTIRILFKIVHDMKDDE